MEELELLVEEDPSAKGIVFSQFVSMLDLVEHRLKLAGMYVCMCMYVVCICMFASMHVCMYV